MKWLVLVFVIVMLGAIAILLYKVMPWETLYHAVCVSAITPIISEKIASSTLLTVEKFTASTMLPF